MFFSNKNKVDNYYLAIHLKEQEGILFIIDSFNKINPIIDQKKIIYTDGWEHIIEDIDEGLYQLELKHKFQLKKVVFFLYSHLIDKTTGNIKQPYQKKIKKIISELELTPLGFIDCQDGVVNYLEKKDNIKLTAIVIEIDKTNLSLFLYKNNQLIFAQSSARSDYFIDDVINLLTKAKEKTLLPSRIILYNSSDLEKGMNQIITHHWSKDFFFQLPKVEIIKEDDLINNLVNLFVNQIRIEKKEKEDLISESPIDGFFIGEDVKEKYSFPSKEGLLPKKNKVSDFFSFFRKIKEKKFTLKFPSLSFSFNLFRLNKNIIFLIGFLLLIFAFFINEYFLHKLKLELYLPTKKITGIYSFSYGAKEAEILTKEVVVEKTISSVKKATGQKEVGSPARGEVVVYNFSKEITFPKGTVIQTKNINFIFDTEVKVASSSLTSDSSAKLPGKAKVKVTAQEIGEQGNLSKGEKFVIKDYDPEVYFAKNESDFVGGVKKTITTVSSDDLNALEKQVISDLKKQKIDFKIAADEKVINLLTDYEIIDKEFSKEANEEADSVEIKAKIKISSLAFNYKKLIDQIIKKITPSLPKDFVLEPGQISYSISKVDKEKRTVDINILAKATKNINKKELIDKIKFKNSHYLKTILKDEFKIDGYQEYHQQPLIIPYYKDILPFFEKNYQVIFTNL